MAFGGRHVKSNWGKSYVEHDSGRLRTEREMYLRGAACMTLPHRLLAIGHRNIMSFTSLLNVLQSILLNNETQSSFQQDTILDPEVYIIVKSDRSSVVDLPTSLVKSRLNQLEHIRSAILR